MREDLGVDSNKYRALTCLEQGKHLYNANRIREALALFEQAIQYDPTLLRAKTAKATCLVSLERVKEAEALCDSILDEDPTFALAYTTKGLVLYKLNEVEEAEKSYRTGAELGKDEPTAYYNTACFYSLIGKEEECKKYLEKTLGMEPRFNANAVLDSDFKNVKGKEWFKELTMFKR